MNGQQTGGEVEVIVSPAPTAAEVDERTEYEYQLEYQDRLTKALHFEKLLAKESDPVKRRILQKHIATQREIMETLREQAGIRLDLFRRMKLERELNEGSDEIVRLTWTADLYQAVADSTTAAVPLVSDARDIVELITQEDIFTHQSLTRTQSGMTILAALLPFGSSRLLREGEEVVEAAVDAVKHADDVVPVLDDVAKVVDDVVGIGPKSAFEIAQQGGKHSGFLKTYVGKSPDELRRAISSLRKQITEHQDKIANPEKYIPNFRTLDSRQQQALLNTKWPSDIARQHEQLEILEGLLKQLGGN